MRETLNNNLAELTKAVDQAILNIDTMETTIEEESERLDARLEGDGETNIYDAIYNDGKKSEYDAFWDAYQSNGNQSHYSYAFAGAGWTNETFAPKYDIIATSINHMFTSCGALDVVSCLAEAGRIFDTSACTTLLYIAQYSGLVTLPILDLRNCANLSYVAIYNYGLKVIQKIILRADGTQTFSNYTLGYNTALSQIEFEGTIGQSGLNVSWSPLNKASLTSVINALSPTTTGLTVTLRLDAVNTAFETTPGAADGSTSDEWLTLAATKSNWTISLINS